MKSFSHIFKLGIALLWVIAGWLLLPSLSESLSLSRLNKAEVHISVPADIRGYAISSQGLIAVLVDESTSHDERRIILVDKNGSRSETMTKVANRAIDRINFSPDGNKLFGSSWWGLWIADIKDGKIVRQISTPAQKATLQSYRSIFRNGHPIQRGETTVECISLSSVVNSAMQASSWKISDASFVREKNILPASKGPFHLVQSALSPDGKQAVAVWKGDLRDKNNQIVKNGFLELWDIVNVEKLRELEEISPKGLGPLTFSADAKYVAAADSVGNGYIWDTQTGRLIQSLSGLRHKIKNQSNSSTTDFDASLSDRVTPLVFTTDNRTIIAALNDGYILAYDLESGLPFKILGKRNQAIGRLTISPDNRKLYFVEDEERRTWEGKKRQTLYVLPLPEFSKAP